MDYKKAWEELKNWVDCRIENSHEMDKPSYWLVLSKIEALEVLIYANESQKEAPKC